MIFTDRATVATTTQLPPLPPRPVVPAVLRDMISAANSEVRATTAALRAGDLSAYVEGFADHVRRSDEIADWCTSDPQGRAYSAAVDEYNRAVYARRVARADAAQAAQNAAQVQQVRAAACKRCWSTHPGEC